jgi:hypothetical protein
VSDEEPTDSPELRRVARLPGRVAPPRDLWPGIEVRIAVSTAPGSGAGTRARRAGTLPRAAWALAATVAALAIGLWLGRDHDAALRVAQSPGAPAALPAAAALPAGFGLDPAYAREREIQLAQAAARLARLPPESQQRVAASFATLQRSIEEIRQALGADPSNALLQELLLNTYQDEMRVVTAVAEATGDQES